MLSPKFSTAASRSRLWLCLRSIRSAYGFCLLSQARAESARRFAPGTNHELQAVTAQLRCQGELVAVIVPLVELLGEQGFALETLDGSTLGELAQALQRPTLPEDLNYVPAGPALSSPSGGPGAEPQVCSCGSADCIRCREAGDLFG